MTVVNLTEAEIEGLRDYVEWHGAAHQGDCPCDDTCRCMCKPLNDAVSSICSKAFDAQVALPEREQGWQPMETAPKDGTPFMGFTEKEPWRSVIARWHQGSYRSDQEIWSLHELNHWEGWPLTHWMPLPSPPKADK